MAGDILRVGACSMAAIPGDLEENLIKIKKWTEKGIEEEVDLLLFPELSLSGYWTNTELYYEAQPREGPAVQDLINFLKSKKENITVSVGLAEDFGGAIYNTQIMLNKEGIVHFYRKTHWPHAEMGVWSCGDRYPIVEHLGFKIGTAICYDNGFPEVHRIYGLQGAELVLSPYAYGAKFDRDNPKTVKTSIANWKEKEKTFLKAAALSNYLWIVACVGAGHVKDYSGKDEYYFPGVILFISPEGKVVNESPDDKIEERLMYMNISGLTNMEQRRGTNNFYKNRRTITYGRITQVP